MALRRCGIFFLRPVDLKEGVRVGSTQFACFLVCRVCIHIQRGLPPKRNSLGVLVQCARHSLSETDQFVLLRIVQDVYSTLRMC